MTTDPRNDEMAERLTSTLFSQLRSTTRWQFVAPRPFDVTDGVLGDAFTALALHEVTQDEDWLGLARHHANFLVELLSTRRIDRMGLFDGLTGLLLVMEAHGIQHCDSEVVTVLRRRIDNLVDQTLDRMRVRYGVTRKDYGHISGVTGVAHYLMCSHGDTRLIRRVADSLADLAESPFPDSFWTPASELDSELTERFPELSFGGRDMSLGRGLAGVTKTLLEAADSLGEQRYWDAASTLVDVVVCDLEAHGGLGISQFQSAPVFGYGPGSVSTRSRNLFDGIGGWKLALAGDSSLTSRLISAYRGDDSTTKRAEGQGLPGDYGLRSGVAGRLYIADQTEDRESGGSECTDCLEDSLSDAVKLYTTGKIENTGPGFWEGFGGTAAVWLGRTSGRGYPTALHLLGGNASIFSEGDVM